MPPQPPPFSTRTQLMFNPREHESLDDDDIRTARLRLAHAKLRRLQPELYARFAWMGWEWRDGRLWSRRSYWLKYIEHCLLVGDSCAAVVMSTSPLLIATYSDELDCVAVLRFKKSLVSEYDLEPGSRLVTVNIYERMIHVGDLEDLFLGPKAASSRLRYRPLIADFLTDDVDRLNRIKSGISENEWRETEELGQKYLSEKDAKPRDGRPLWCSLPAGHVELPDKAPRREPDKPVTILEITKRILFVNLFLITTLWAAADGVWYAVALFGTMLVLSVVSLFFLPRDLKNRVSVREAWTVKRVETGLITFAVSTVLGLLGELILVALDGFWPSFAIWLSCFVAVAAFYPFRDMKNEYPTFTPWAIYAALCGFISVGVAHLADWLEHLA